MDRLRRLTMEPGPGRRPEVPVSRMTSPSNKTFTFSRTARVGSACAAVGGAVLLTGLAVGSTLTTHLALIGLISIVIWQACDPFAEAAQWIGRRYRIPGSVRGATLDAVASSMPELFAGIFFVLRYDDFGSTVATCAGSAVYNMILIPAICGLVISFVRRDRPRIEIVPAVLERDGAFFLLSEAVLLYFIFTERLNWVMAVLFLGIYLLYILRLRRDALAYQRGEGDEAALDIEIRKNDHVAILGETLRLRLTTSSAVGILAVTAAITAGACYQLVDSCETIATTLEVPAFFVAVILVAAASSVPDTMLSLGAALRGDDSGAISNAFGSNIFDINICLSVPVLLFMALHPGKTISLQHVDGVFGLGVLLIVLSGLTLGLLRHGYHLGRAKSLALCALYLIFITYAVVGSIRAND